MAVHNLWAACHGSDTASVDQTQGCPAEEEGRVYSTPTSKWRWLLYMRTLCETELKEFHSVKLGGRSGENSLGRPLTGRQPGLGREPALQSGGQVSVLPC